MGLDYGPAFQAIESINVGESTVLAKLRLPTCVPQAGAGWAGPTSQHHGRRIAGDSGSLLPWLARPAHPLAT